MQASVELQQIAKQTAPNLEKVLVRGRATSHLAENLQLRYSQCGLATKALQNYFAEQYDAPTERLIHVSSDDNLRGLSYRRQTHVILRTEDGRFIDPTYGQFMNLIGLTPEQAQASQLEHLYPSAKIASFTEQTAAKFSQKFAQHTYNTWQSSGHAINQPTPLNPRLSALRNASLDQMESTYNDLWDVNNYRELTPEETPEGLAVAAAQIAQSLIWLDNNNQ